MKNLILLSAFALTMVFAFNMPGELEAGKPLTNLARFTWESTTHDFGKIVKNEPVSHKFVFTNKGSVPLVITKVKPSCGCTVTDYTNKPIAPGKMGFVNATYNAKALGQFNKSITVTANVEGGPERLFIKGEVVNP